MAWNLRHSGLSYQPRVHRIAQRNRHGDGQWKHAKAATTHSFGQCCALGFRAFPRLRLRDGAAISSFTVGRTRF
jgi:hypothetical protein